MIFLSIISLIFSYVFIPSRVEVAPGRVTLFDLASTYTGVDPEDLKSITLAYFPEGKYTLKGSYITEMALRKGIEITLESTDVLVVVKPVDVSTITTTPQSTEILSMASEVILNVASDLSIPASCIVATLLEYNGKVLNYERKITYYKLPNGLVSASVGFFKDGFLKGYLTMRFEMSCKRKVPIAKRMIMLGDTIHPDEIEQRSVDVFRIRGKPVRYEEVLYAVARRPIRAGDVITQDAIRRKYDVERGQVIMAYVVLPGVKVTTLVEALENGYVGDTIRARNLMTGRVITGTIMPGPVLKVMEVER